MKEGDSAHVRQKGKYPIASFKIIQGDKTVIEPWKGVNAKIMEWIRHSSALLGVVREEEATFMRVDKDVPVYYEDSMQADTKMDMAFFTAEKDGREYNVANRLLVESGIMLKPGDRVTLEFLGCCSISNVKRFKQSTS